MFLWRFAGIGNLLDVAEGDSAFMGGNEKEEGMLACHGYFKRAVQG